MFWLTQKTKCSFDRKHLLAPNRSPALGFQGLGSVHTVERVESYLWTPQGAGRFKELKKEISSGLGNEAGWQWKHSLD